ncbi:ABC transporter substrate-binding protein [Chloroflexota bacterium]
MRKTICIVANLLVLVCLVAAASVCGGGQKKVLLVFSYHAEYPWVEEETRGIEDVFNDTELKIEKLYLDTKRNTSEEWKQKVAEEAIKEIDEFKPDLVIVFDDNACDLVARKYIGDSLPFVFCGMNRDPGDYGFPASNITGVIEREHLEETIDLLLELVPDVKKAAIVADDSPTSRGFLDRAKQAALPIEITEFYATNDFDAWKDKIQALQSEVDAIGLFTYHTIKGSGAGESLPAQEILKWTLQNSDLPEFALSDFTLEGGALCGVATSGYEQGRTAGEIAVKILNGEKPADIPVECPTSGDAMVNKDRARELGIAIPAGLAAEVTLLPPHELSVQWHTTSFE